jgi:hypothetical protein
MVRHCREGRGSNSKSRRAIRFELDPEKNSPFWRYKTFPMRRSARLICRDETPPGGLPSRAVQALDRWPTNLTHPQNGAFGAPLIATIDIEVVAGLRGTSPWLEQQFDDAAGGAVQSLNPVVSRV